MNDGAPCNKSLKTFNLKPNVLLTGVKSQGLLGIIKKEFVNSFQSLFLCPDETFSDFKLAWFTVFFTHPSLINIGQRWEKKLGSLAVHIDSALRGLLYSCTSESLGQICK